MLTIGELPEYIRRADKLLTEAQRRGVIDYLAAHPKAGDLLEGTGGIRKLRWGRDGRGKSGGVRVIYYFKKQDNEIWLLTIYSKNEVESIPAHVLRQIAKEIENV